MAALVIEDGKAKAAGIVGVFLLVMGFAVSVCGFVWIGFGGGDGTGLWSGFGVREFFFDCCSYIYFKLRTILHNLS